MKSPILIISMCFLTLPLLIAQPQLRNYKTMDYMTFLRESNPSIANELARLERDLSKNYLSDKIAQVTLPVVFHVLYSNDSENITRANINRQLEILNADFSFQDEITDHINDPKDEFSRRASSSLLSFCRASATPNNKITDGVNYVPVSTSEWISFTDMKSKKTGGVDPWNPDKYINIWICNLPKDNAGFAQLPYGPKDLDGIVIHYTYFFGSRVDDPYALGRTLTHLMGNYLNLYPLWGEVPCGDDYVDDTPVHNDINYGCPEGNHITACRGNSLEMTMNFMDNTDDACTYMFTKGQMIRMQNTVLLKGTRHGLLNTPIVCTPLFIDTKIFKSNRTDDIQVDDNLEKTIIFPNPVSDQITIQFNKERSADLQLQLVGNSGQILYRSIVPKGTINYSIDVKDMPNGVFIVRLSNNHYNFSRPIIKVQ